MVVAGCFLESAVEPIGLYPFYRKGICLNSRCTLRSNRCVNKVKVMVDNVDRYKWCILIHVRSGQHPHPRSRLLDGFFAHHLIFVEFFLALIIHA